MRTLTHHEIHLVNGAANIETMLFSTFAGFGMGLGIAGFFAVTQTAAFNTFIIIGTTTFSALVFSFTL